MSIIQRQIQRSNQDMMVLCLLGIVVVLILGLFNAIFYYNVLLGPFPLHQSDITELSTSTRLMRYHVTVRGDSAADTGFNETLFFRDGSKQPQADYHLLFIDDYSLLVKVPRGANPNKENTGILKELVAASSVDRRVAEKIEADYTWLDGSVLPYILDTTSNDKFGVYLGLPLLLGVFGFCVLGIVRARQRSHNLMRHPLMLSLSRFGDPLQVAEEINRELRIPHTSVGHTHLTESWLIVLSSAAKVMRLDDILWVNHKERRIRYWGVFRTIYTLYSLRLLDKHNHRITLRGSKSTINRLQQVIAARVPWVNTGSNLPSLNLLSTVDVAAEVSERRERFTNAGIGGDNKVEDELSLEYRPPVPKRKRRRNSANLDGDDIENWDDG